MKKCFLVLPQQLLNWMNKIFFTIVFFFLSTNSFAEWVETEASYIYGGDISRNEACSLAKEKAKLKALEKVLGQKISSEETEFCSEIEGKTNCERNQFFLSQFNGNISAMTEPVEKVETVTVGNQEANICKVRIRANVVKKSNILDVGFDINVKLNEKNFKDGEELKIDIELDNPVYLTIFNVFPYEKKDYQVQKLFPNIKEINNYIDTKNLKLPLNKKIKYRVVFPNLDQVNIVDEYLVFIASEKNIKWLDKYAEEEDLKAAYFREKSVKYVLKEYKIYK